MPKSAIDILTRLVFGPSLLGCRGDLLEFGHKLPCLRTSSMRHGRCGNGRRCMHAHVGAHLASVGGLGGIGFEAARATFSPSGTSGSYFYAPKNTHVPHATHVLVVVRRRGGWIRACSGTRRSLPAGAGQRPPYYVMRSRIPCGTKPADGATCRTQSSSKIPAPPLWNLAALRTCLIAMYPGHSSKSWVLSGLALSRSL